MQEGEIGDLEIPQDQEQIPEGPTVEKVSSDQGSARSAEDATFMGLNEPNEQSQIAPIRMTMVQFPVQNWQQLQTAIKLEKQTVDMEDKLKQQLLQEVSNDCHKYYQAHIDVLEESQTVSAHQKYLITSDTKLFENAATYINEILRQLNDNPRLCSCIFDYHNDSAVTSTMKSLIQTIVHCFYDNIASDTMWNQPIMKLISDVIENQVNRKDTIESLRWDKQDTLGKYVLEEFTRRSENVKYTKFIFKNVLHSISKVETTYELDPIKIQDYIREKKRNTELKERNMSSSVVIQPSHKSQYQSSIRPTTMIKPQQIPSMILTTQQKPNQIPKPQENMAHYYAALLKYYDQTKPKDGRKPLPGQISDQLSKLLVFSEEQKQAKFMPIDKKLVISQDIKDLQTPKTTKNDANGQTSKAFGDALQSQRTETAMESDVKRYLHGYIKNLKGLVNQLMDSIFKNLYTAPVGIRIVCKFIEIQLRRKFPKATEQQIYENIFSFLFNVWLLPQFGYPKSYQTLKMIKEEHEQAIRLIVQIVQKLVRSQRYEHKDEQYYEKLNQYIADLQPSLKDYLTEFLNLSPEPLQQVVNINSKQIIARKERITKTNCVCMPLVDVRTICSLLKEITNTQFIPVEERDQITTLIKRASLSLTIAADANVFEKRSDIVAQKTIDPSQVYALILGFQLPKGLEKNYYELIQPKKRNQKQEESSIVQKVKSSLRRVLNDIQDIQSSSVFNMSGVSLRRVLQVEEERQSYVSQYSQSLLWIRYILQNLPKLPQEYQYNNHKMLFDEMYAEYEQRKVIISEVTTQTRLELIKAKENIRKNFVTLKDTLDKLRKERQRKDIYEFIEKTPIRWCISSPKTREGLYSVRALKMRNNTQIEEDKIWVEDQKECIHNAINLEFIRQIVGGGASDAKPNNTRRSCEFSTFHCEDIKGFIEIFAKLPEVQEAILTGEDKCGVKRAYFEFLDPLVDYMMQKSEFTHDQEWVQEALQKYVSRKIYDRVFPKERTYKDAGLHFRIKTLEWITYDHLDISKQNRVNEMWDLAADILLQMDYARTALEKLDAVLQATKMLTDVLKLTSLKDEAASADTTLPIMTYILLRAAPQRFYSNLNFIELFIHDSKMVQGDGYCLKQIQCATSWLESLDPKIIKMDELQYQKLIAQGEIKYGIHYVRKRNRSERISLQISKIDKIMERVLNSQQQ